jgi:hypothetical protein
MAPTHLGYPALFVLVAAESAGVLVPGETGAGRRGRHRGDGHLQIGLVVAPACQATIGAPPAALTRFVGMSGDEPLAPVDVVRRAGDGRVDHEVNGEGGDVGRSDDAPDRQGGA